MYCVFYFDIACIKALDSLKSVIESKIIERKTI